MDSRLQDNRCYGIDLLKTLAMFMVVLLHVLGQGGVLEASRNSSINHVLAWTTEIGAYCAVNCFAMATGFLMVGKPLKYRKIVPMWLTVSLYSIVIMIIGYFLLPGTAIKEDILCVFPVTYNSYWYFTSYFLMFFFIPYINKLIDVLSKKEFCTLLWLGFVLLSLLHVLSYYNRGGFKLSEGYSPWWLMYMYLLGAGIKKHDLFAKIKARTALFGYMGMILLTIATKFLLWMVSKVNIPLVSDLVAGYGTDRFVSYISPTIVASAVFLMLFCLKIKIAKPATKVLKFISPLLFQVYIIHTHFVLWKGFIAGRFAHFANLNPALMVFAVFGAAIGIFIVCLAIDFLRLQLFKVLRVNSLVDKVANKLILKWEKRNIFRKDT